MAQRAAAGTRYTVAIGGPARAADTLERAGADTVDTDPAGRSARTLNAGVETAAETFDPDARAARYLVADDSAGFA
jgi:hypothetical protein